jgi:choline dehydrogenase-like flavoprotein
LKGDVLIVGSGVGGATVAKELATRGHKVTILEKGQYHKLGTEIRSLRFYSNVKSVEGLEIIRAIMVGGSSMVTLANGVRALQNELRSLGIDLETEFKETETELGVSPFPERLMGERTKKLRQASIELGYEVEPMPKFIDYSKCRRCGGCDCGCIYGAKWTAQKTIGEALRAGARLLIGTSIGKVLHSGGEVRGVLARGASGTREIYAENVVLAGGGIETPIILQKSGLTNAGGNFFVDPFLNTVGVTKGEFAEDEVSMPTFIDKLHDKEGLTIFPAFFKPWAVFLNLPAFKKFHALHRRRIMMLMTKITDDDVGEVDADGTIHKRITENDARKLKKGDEISRKILLQAGVDPKSICSMRVRAGHPGGTAGIGRVVNTDQETEISRLFVSDASVLPKAPGKPPVLTIVALSKRFSRILSSQYF